MIKFYKSLIKSLEFLLNITFVLQIAIMITVFLTASYWFFDLIGSSAFEFAKPLAESIIDFVRLFYHEDIEIGGQFIDGSLLLFDILALIAVFLITKSKFYVYQTIEKLEYQIKVCNNKYQEKFNQELQQDFEDKIKRLSNIAILIKFDVKNLMLDSQREDTKTKVDEVFKIFYSTMKTLTECRFARTDDKMLIMFDNFSRFDNLLNFIELSIDKIRINMKKDRWALYSYVALEAYGSGTNFKAQVYPVLEKLLTLNCKNESICLGNFKLRYELNGVKMYNFAVKGSYKIGEDCEVYSLVKKD